MINKVIKGDCLIELKNLPENSVDSIVTDPPYELGFMGKKWDNTGIANNPLMWKECLRVLKPGGYLLSFGGTRTYHRMASAIEDAGFEVRDMIEWVYGSGFPKSLNIGKAVDKLQGNEREVTRIDNHGTRVGAVTTGGTFGGEQGGYNLGTEAVVTKGTSEWEGWGTALKPAHEPICMARKPLAEKTVAQNVLKYGTGGINIDESRVEAIDGGWKPTKQCNISSKGHKGGAWGNETFVSERTDVVQEMNNLGRFPANLIHDNSEEVRECFPETKNGGQNSTSKRETWLRQETEPTKFNGDSGNASRFFKSIIYQAKASKSERNKGCEGLEGTYVAQGNQAKAELARGNTDFNNSNKHNNVQLLKNHHPTVKPIALMEYLIKMVTPKGGVVLDPFAGSGSTLVAAKQNGFQYIGIEMTEEYIPIIEARLNAIISSNETQK